MKRIVLLPIIAALLQMTGSRADAQATREINGIVTCFKNVPLNNVRISAVKSGKEALTDANGQFIISVLSKDILMASASGFVPKKVKTGKDNLYKIDLAYKDNSVNFEEAVRNKHIGEEALQKAIYANISKNVKDYSHYENIFDLIDNEIYEVNVSGNSVTNKKIKSMDHNPQVLYVVDDKIVTDISYINPTYVRSIEFVEDVGATIYGSKGANGVLKIYLK